MRLLLSVSVDVQSAETPVPLIVPHPMVGVVVPRGNSEPTRAFGHPLPIRRQHSENPHGFDGISCVLWEAEHAVVAVAELFAERRRAGACCRVRVAIAKKELRAIEAITPTFHGRLAQLVEFTRKPRLRMKDAVAVIVLGRRQGASRALAHQGRQ